MICFKALNNIISNETINYSVIYLLIFCSLVFVCGFQMLIFNVGISVDSEGIKQPIVMSAYYADQPYVLIKIKL
jgi:hypothetical protein